ncbi:MAG: DUF3887 domain-containing protein [Bacteroidales bacterium]|nr:DUF3887 domain-containing protein [Bacteroidales bacterium]
MKIIRLNINRLIISSVTIVLVLTLLISCKSEFKKLPENKTDKSKIEFATKIATSYFMALKNGNSYDFENNAIKDFTEKMTPNFQKQTYDQIKKTFGNFESLKYSGTWVEKENNDFQIIRLKGNFGQQKTPLEIRVVVNNSNKIAGLWVKPWKDNLNNY